MFHDCPLCRGSGYLNSGAYLDHPERRAAGAHVAAFVAQLGGGRLATRSSYEIAEAIGVHQRSIGFIANEARQRGHLIGSRHGEGYYLIRTAEEYDDTVAHIQSRVNGIARTIRALAESWASR